MATAKAKAKSAFSYGGKQYQPGDEVEAPDHEIMQLVEQGHVEDPRGQPAQQSQPAKQAQPGGQHAGHGHEHEQQHAGRKHESEPDGDDD